MAETPSSPTTAEPLSDTERMVKEALAEAEASLNQMKDEVQTTAKPINLPDLSGAPPTQFDAAVSGIDLLGDVELHVTVELGRTQMLVEDVLRLNEGSIVELDKLAGDPVDVFVNGRLVARGEVLVLNDMFCIRVSEIVADLEEEAVAAAEEQRVG
jgi:flagellar motor switch protein FliN